jgi:hypothetical protein
MKRLVLALLVLAAVAAAAPARADFDHTHAAWTGLLARHVVVIDGGKASKVRYAGFAADRAALKAYLASLSAVTEGEFRGFTREQRLAFLINAYNAYMIEKVLTKYPDIRSVWDFGKIVGNPFKDRFFTLFGKPMSLDGIEHDTIRAPGAYDEPRIHFAVNCASIGCPMLREEAYVGNRLDRQLEEQTRRFLGDRSRNRVDAAGTALEVSKIFDWYGKDFRGLEAWLRARADVLSDNPAERASIREGRLRIRFLDYDWALNAAQ